MTTYNVPALDTAVILAGTRDLLLARAGAKHHARAGGPVTLLPGRLAPIQARCTVRARLMIGEAGLVRVLDLHHTEEGEPIARLLRAAEQASPQAAHHQGLLALRLGHADWPALRLALIAPRDRVRLAGAALARELVAWTEAAAVAKAA